MNSSVQRTLPRRVYIGLLLGICLLPPLVAWVMYLNPGLAPRARVNRGELIEPPRLIGNAALKTLEGKTFQFKDLAGKWGLVWLIASPYGQACPEKLYQMRQIALALNKDRIHFERVVIVLNPRNRQLLDAYLKEYPGTWVITGPPDSLPKLVAQFLRPGDLKPGGSGGFYVIDPKGNLILHYLDEADPKDILKDLERLLKYSR
jgi:cytochrome oxidase Cu insertion factor (SCO1/SenC/PrrC family)